METVQGPESTVIWEGTWCSASRSEVKGTLQVFLRPARTSETYMTRGVIVSDNGTRCHLIEPLVSGESFVCLYGPTVIRGTLADKGHNRLILYTSAKPKDSGVGRLVKTNPPRGGTIVFPTSLLVESKSSGLRLSSKTSLSRNLEHS